MHNDDKCQNIGMKEIIPLQLVSMMDEDLLHIMHNDDKWVHTDRRNRCTMAKEGIALFIPVQVSEVAPPTQMYASSAHYVQVCCARPFMGRWGGP